MRFSIKNVQAGSTELLLALPFLFLTALGIGYVGKILLEKSRVERAAWTYAVSRADGADPDKATAMLEPPKTSAENATKWTEREESACNPLWIGWLASRQTLPVAFRTLAASECNRSVEVLGRSTVPDPIPQWIRNTDSEDVFSQDLALRSREKFPGSSLEKSETLRQSLWLEAMIRAGFGPVPLQLLGVSDLAAAAADVGLGVLGAPVAEALSEARSAAASLASGDLLKKIGDEVKNDGLDQVL